MWNNIFKIVFRNIARYKLFSFINIVGLSLGLTVFIIVYLYVKFEFSYDTFHENYENIYRLEVYKDNGNNSRLTRWTPYFLTDELVQNYPEVISRTRFGYFGDKLLSNESKSIQFNEDYGFYADNETFKIFTYNIIEGEKVNMLVEPNTMVLSKTIADKLFPNESAVGKIVYVENKEQYKVSAVMEDIPANSHFEYSFFISMPTLRDKQTIEELNDPNDEYYCSYVLLNENANLENVNSSIENIINDKLIDKSIKTKLYLKPLPDIHFYSGEVSRGRDSNIVLLSIYVFLGFFTLVLALLNYMNLTTAFSSIRAKEIGVRKVVGANRLKISVQFISESVAVTLISLIIAIVLVEVSLPTVSEFTRTDLRLHNSGQLTLYIEILALSLLAAVIAGSYPAFHLSRLKPVKILKGASFRMKGGSFAQKTFVFFQFFITLLFICFSLVMFQLSSYLLNKSMGFEKENVLVEQFYYLNDVEKAKCKSLANELSALSVVEEACFTVDIPSYIHRNQDVYIENDENKLFSVCYSYVGDNFFDTYEIPIIEGRNFHQGSAADLKNSCIVNQTFLEKYGISNPIGMPLNGGEYNIVGVVRDFHFRSFGNEIQPLMLFYEDIDSLGRFYLSLKMTEINQSTSEQVKKVYQSIFPDRMYNFKQFNEIYDRMMLIMVNNLYKLIMYFTIITIFIAVMGLFALVLFTVNKRFKEIGVRKTMGADSLNIFKILSWDILKIMVLANLVGLPLAWYLIQSLLSSLENAMELNPVIFVVASTISFVIVIAIMVERVYKASIASPVNALKYE